MKQSIRAIALVLAFILTTALCACGQQEPEVSSVPEPEVSSTPIITEYFDGQSTQQIDAQAIMESIEAGTFVARDTEQNPIDVTLGMTETPIRRAFEEHGELFGSEGESYIRFSTGTSQMYIPTADPSLGMVAIVHLDTAYGFEINITNRESIEAVLGKPATVGLATAEQAEVLPEPTAEIVRMVYESGNNRLEFFLIDNLLVATSLSVKALWQR